MPDCEKVIKAWECCNPFNRKCNECSYEKDCYHDGISRHMVADALSLVKEQDAVVKCRDCKFFIGEGHYCKIRGIGRALKPDDFCSDGERSDNNDRQ